MHFFYRLLYLGQYRAISHMEMDGSNVTDIVTTDVIYPYGLTVDLYSDRIWWCDYTNDRIE